MTNVTGTLLRMATAGSVDDGKSTLVGRLLHDSKSVLSDQLAAVERVSREKGLGIVDLALLTDGLRAEREQGITIDVAYRYFATAKRTFVLADCPGHVQYTRNTVTGSSTADVLVLLVDVRKGVLEQTRRHLAVAALLRVPHLVFAVNKIDLVDFDRARFEAVSDELAAVASGLGIEDVRCVPVSALLGDNIVDRSEQTPWYDGPSLLDLLEELPSGTAVESEPFRFPVQLTIRPQGAARDPQYAEYRGYAGQIASGVVRVGDAVTVLPLGRQTTVTGIDAAGEQLAEAFAPMSVTLRLADQVDITRGELIAGVADAPTTTQDVDGLVCWLSDRALKPGSKVLLKHTTRTVQGIVKEIKGRLDLDTLAPVEADALTLNDIGRVTIRLAAPIVAEDYTASRRTGAFLLIDPQMGSTLAAGMIRGGLGADDFDAETLDWSI